MMQSEEQTKPQEDLAIDAPGDGSTDRAESLRKAGLCSAFVAGLFSLIVAIIMLAVYMQGPLYQVKDILEVRDLIAEMSQAEDSEAYQAQLANVDPKLVRFAELWAQLIETPTDEELKRQIQEMDREVRSEVLYRTQMLKLGGFLLAGGGIVVVAGLLLASSVGEHYPDMPGEAPKAGAQKRSSDLAAGAVGLLVVGLITVGLLASRQAAAPQQASSDDELPAVPDLQLNWTAFRGTSGQGNAAGISAVLPGVDEGTVLWKTDIDLPGKASPIAQGGYVFLSAADERTRKVACFAAATGKKLWEQKVGMIPGAPTEAPEVYQDDTGGTSLAAPTPTAGAGTVFSLFATGDLVAYEQGGKGKQKWAMNLGAPANMYGHSTSLLMVDGMLIVQYDQEYGEDEEGNAVPKSVLLAKDPATGQDLWRTVRPVGASWASPILADTPSGKQIITAGNPWVMAHNPETGEELWRAKLLYGDVAPSPAYADGLVFVAMEGAGTFAIRTDGTGDVSETHVAWKDEMATSPDIVSPVATRDYLFTVSTYGQLTCFNAKTGDVVWENYFDASFNTSPLVVGEQGDQLLLITTRGRMILVKIGEDFEQIVDADLEENVYTTPAMGILPESGKPLMFVRGKKHLMCIGPAGALEIQEP